jgi:hypothetical protein
MGTKLISKFYLERMATDSEVRVRFSALPLPLPQALVPFVESWPLFELTNLLYIVCRTLSTGDQPVSRPLPTKRTTEAKDKRSQTSTPPVGFEPTTSVLERAANAIGVIFQLHSLIQELGGPLVLAYT